MSSQESSPFKDFINSLDLSGFSEIMSDLPSSSVLDTVSPGITRLHSSESDRNPRYQIEVGTAHFDMAVNPDMFDSSFHISYPSRITRFDQDELLDAVTCMMDAANPRSRYTPHVSIDNGEREETLDLSKYWDGKVYEKALEQPLRSICYFVDPSSLPFYKFAQSMGRTPSPHFVYGFYNTIYGDMNEIVKISYTNNSHVEVALAGELLSRNREYYFGNRDEDAAELQSKIAVVTKMHPIEPIMLQ